MKIATWNVNSLKVRLPQVLEWLNAEQPDVLALQETKLQDRDFPLTELQAAGYQVLFSGQKTYNGVALLSRINPTEHITDLPGLSDPQRRVLGATIGELRVLNLYVPNGQAVGSEKYLYKIDWLEHLQTYLREQLARYPNLVVLGDFNIAPEDLDVHDPQAWTGQILCSDAERAAFRHLLDMGLHDSFRHLEKAGGHFSWWDYRAAGFRRNLGLRIDHILLSSELIQHIQRCWIDTVARAAERPSDHAPVIVELAMPT